MDWGDCAWTTVELILVIEGFLPFFAPVVWWRVFLQLMQLCDGKIRFFGLPCIAADIARLLLH